MTVLYAESSAVLEWHSNGWSALSGASVRDPVEHLRDRGAVRRLLAELPKIASSCAR